MGGSKKPPPPPTYKKPEPVEEFNLTPEESSYQQQVRGLLSNQDLIEPYFTEREKAYTASTQKQLQDLFEPMQRQIREDTARRFGGLDTSVYSDLTTNLAEKQAEAAKQMAQEYQQQTLADRMNYSNFLMNQVNAMRGMQAQPHEMGFAYANPENMFNLGNYQNQLAYYQASNPPSIWSRLFGGMMGGLGGLI